MNTFFLFFKRFLHTKKRSILCLFLGVFFALFLLCACTKSVDYFSYVSELRSNVLLYRDENYSLRIYSLEKESPYLADGVVSALHTRTEIRLLAPSGDKTCSVFFTVDGSEYGGEASFDNVKGEYYYACPVDTSALSQVDVRVCYGEETCTLTAKSVLTNDTLTPKQVLQTLLEKEFTLFESLTDKYGFAGEIYMRLLYEDAPYYYVGIIDRQGNTTAFLLNAVTGKVLAKRQS